MMRIWPTSRRRKGKVPKNAVDTASSSKGKSTQSHALRSGISLWAEAATTSASCSSPSQYFSERIQSLSERRNDFVSQLEFEIESSKSHWTESSVAASDCNSEEEKLPNSVVFEKLKEHPEWSPLFRRWPDKLEIGKKIAEGGQAEIYEACGTNDIKSFDDGSVSEELRWPRDMDLVVKVFKDGSPLQDLQQLWPPAIAVAAFRPFDVWERVCWARGAVLLKDGRFAFVFDRMWGDLRKLIDGRMLKRNGTPPFTLEEALPILLSIAWGMGILHKIGVLHRDLKAANVLMLHEDLHHSYGCPAFIADFESSVGVVGTGFWRAPEVLLALKNGGSRAVRFTQQSDVYSFAMTCYEVITGREPFEGHPLSDYDVVLCGERPILPDETNTQLKALMRKCWHQDPLQRPSFKEIFKNLQAMTADHL